MILHSCIFILISIFIQCCTSKPFAGFQFAEERFLPGKVLSVQDSKYLRYPFRIRQSDSLLYILDLHGPDYYCHTLTFPEMRQNSSLALRGNGPEEFLSIENIRLDSEGTLYLLDANNNTISIRNPLNNNFNKRIHLSKNLIRCLDFALINDSLFVIPDYGGKCRINIVDDSGNIRRQLFKIPTKKRQDPNIPDIVLAQAWRSFLDYNPDNGVLAMVTQLGQVIEIYNLKTNEIINILYGKLGEPEFANQGDYAIPTGIMGYSDVHVGKDKIYTLFWGTSFKDIRKENPYNRIEGGNIIQVFSLDGTPLIQYTLDKHITGFSIDENRNTLLGLDVNHEQQIVEYQL
ncbi:BF3164 family lipoprotein [Proteiniphilum sp. UBA1028]|uniref:BF3164 family lipoprotein n=1 Tax=Proteiniphilum sp. UBA1028 TaxID=1947251 RepID=UPI0025D17E31|nr:BF3164 family lipoprotein [Proteiniphilum sp. UBA1028]